MPSSSVDDLLLRRLTHTSMTFSLMDLAALVSLLGGSSGPASLHGGSYGLSLELIGSVASASSPPPPQAVSDQAPQLHRPHANNLHHSGSGGAGLPPRWIRRPRPPSTVDPAASTSSLPDRRITGLVNKASAANARYVARELLAEDLARGRGLLCRALLRSQAAAPAAFTDVFAALASAVNARLPSVGRLLLARLVLRVRRAHAVGNRQRLAAAARFVAHLVNQGVAHDLLALELAAVLLDEPTADSVEVAVGFVAECGAALSESCPRGVDAVFDCLRKILHDGDIEKRVQFMVEDLFAIRKSKFRDHPSVRPELDLVEPEDQPPADHIPDRDVEPGLRGGRPQAPVDHEARPGARTLRHDRRVLHQGEDVHELLRPAGAQKLCDVDRAYQASFEACFARHYATAHLMQSDELRASAGFFARLLAADALPWRGTLGRVRVTEEDTTSSARIFLKVVFQDLADQLGIRMLSMKMNNDSRCVTLSSRETVPGTTRFAINFFTAIGLGGVTESARSLLVLSVQ
ncbi:hypothetical protein PR202_gb25768 [Eleusine coracana subsp. coracana]|uniref:MIF4G domain-containing protein n=1 Tax=Eleusine coracana subsp. coracana TaxID=191504 RepID=A0AAV5FMJ2_ELECO|nr:hypothetical protein PR202_gb25768 [Eleusine coracana subsp. coracana]